MPGSADKNVGDMVPIPNRDATRTKNACATMRENHA